MNYPTIIFMPFTLDGSIDYTGHQNFISALVNIRVSIVLSSENNELYEKALQAAKMVCKDLGLRPKYRPNPAFDSMPPSGEVMSFLNQNLHSVSCITGYLEKGFRETTATALQCVLRAINEGYESIVIASNFLLVNAMVVELSQYYDSLHEGLPFHHPGEISIVTKEDFTFFSGNKQAICLSGIEK